MTQPPISVNPLAASWSDASNRFYMVGSAIVVALLVYFGIKWCKQDQADKKGQAAADKVKTPQNGGFVPQQPGGIQLPQGPANSGGVPLPSGNYSTTKFKSLSEKLRNVAEKGTFTTGGEMCEVCKAINSMPNPELAAFHAHYLTNYSHNLRIEIEAWKKSGCNWTPWTDDTVYEETLSRIAILSA